MNTALVVIFWLVVAIGGGAIAGYLTPYIVKVVQLAVISVRIAWHFLHFRPPANLKPGAPPPDTPIEDVWVGIVKLEPKGEVVGAVADTAGMWSPLFWTDRDDAVLWATGPGGRSLNQMSGEPIEIRRFVATDEKLRLRD